MSICVKTMSRYYILLTYHQVIKLSSLKPFVDECEDKPEV